MNQSFHIIGIDLAWQAERNPSAIAVGQMKANQLEIIEVHKGVIGLDNILALIAQTAETTQGIAIDASLIINNLTGQRQCEKAITRRYGGRKAGCHASNLTLYPNPDSVNLARVLEDQGFRHLATPCDTTRQERWLIECYPHPALIEIFELPERLLYKKGRVDQKRTGQINLAQLLRELARSQRLALTFAPQVQYLLDENIILDNKGRALKEHEDALDAIVCAYIGGLYRQCPTQDIFGDPSQGYIYVPQGPVLQEKLSWIERLTLFQSLFHK